MERRLLAATGAAKVSFCSVEEVDVVDPVGTKGSEKAENRLVFAAVSQSCRRNVSSCAYPSWVGCASDSGRLSFCCGVIGLSS